jgi:class 3 adenylate cyclase
VPETRYARSGPVHIAYQVVGDGPVDLVYVPSWLSQVEALWEEPAVVRFIERVTSFARLILFDRRGTGLSDPVIGAPTLEERMDDVRAVLDAVGSRRAALFGFSEGGPMSALFAATHPARTSALILYGTAPRALRAPDYPWGRAPEDDPTLHWDEIAERWGQVDDVGIDVWGRIVEVSRMSPSAAGDERLQRWLARVLRLSASPGAAREIVRAIAETDVRDVLPLIRVPTMILHRVEDAIVPIEVGRYVASLMPRARYIELDGCDHLPVLGDSDAVIGEIEEFLTGMRQEREPDRVLATILFTDIADSTRHAVELGDKRWRDLLLMHDHVVRHQLERFAGREVKTIGDGFLATFDGPARAIRCARAIVEAMRPLGIEARAGLHTGECEVIGEDIGGLAVHIAARVSALAGRGEVLASRTVTDLVAGSKIRFAARGEHALKGVPGTWELFAVEPG